MPQQAYKKPLVFLLNGGGQGVQNIGALVGKLDV